MRIATPEVRRISNLALRSGPFAPVERKYPVSGLPLSLYSLHRRGISFGLPRSMLTSAACLSDVVYTCSLF